MNVSKRMFDIIIEYSIDLTYFNSCKRLRPITTLLEKILRVESKRRKSFLFYATIYTCVTNDHKKAKNVFYQNEYYVTKPSLRLTKQMQIMTPIDAFMQII